MKNSCKKTISIIAAIIVTIYAVIPASAQNTEDIVSAAAEKAAEYITETLEDPQPGSQTGDWSVFGLARSKIQVPENYFEDYYAALEEYIISCSGVLTNSGYTEYSRTVVVLTALGKDPENIAGYNLLEPLGDYNKVSSQGINGTAWALIALDCGAYEMPENHSASVQATRELYIQDILSAQRDDGGWAIGSVVASDPDITAMMLYALAGYTENEAVAEAVEAGIECLSALQNDDGGYSSWGTANAESTAQALVALCELGISPEDDRFVKNGNTIIDKIISYQTENGGFEHTEGAGASRLPTDQCFYALVAAQRYLNGDYSLFTIADPVSVSESSDDSSVQKLPVIYPDIGFTDIEGASCEEAVTALAERGIITGYTDGTYLPDKTITRAEFTAIVVRGLGLEIGGGESFSDVDSGAWYADFISTAAYYGIVNGTGNGEFAPENTITWQEAAVMTARAANLCSLDTEVSDSEVLNILAPYGGYGVVASWARESVAFCYKYNIIDESAYIVFPAEQAITRGEMAEMLYSMLKAAELI